MLTLHTVRSSRLVGSLIIAVGAAGLVVGSAGCTGSRTASNGEYATTGSPRTFARTTSTNSPVAQRWFNDGLLWTYSFNHDEAVRSFRRAVEADPACAMAWWGIALCRGPHINNPTMSEDACREAWDALNNAKVHAGHCTPVERTLIEALEHRYVDPSTTSPLPLDAASRAPLDKAYADAMARVHATFGSDNDVATLYAESLMDLRPWDLWTLDGQPREITGTVTGLLETVLSRDPDHPGANHYYIHAVEASPQPERAERAANRLRTLVPQSGHMVHMPSHIDVRTGRWNLAADQNEKAMAVHRDYERKSPKQGLYRAYMFHNNHFLTYACMMSGRSKDAIAAAQGMLRSIPEEFYRDFGPVADAYTSIGVESLMRFGKWDEILKYPEPRAELPISRAMWRFARGVALAAQGDVDGARKEQALFSEYRSRVPQGAMMAINPADKVLQIADEMLEGEILYHEGNVDRAVERLSAAVEIEDSLMYIEPPDWVQPVRHALGAILLDAGRADEAAKVYQADLKKWPENGWSLYGLARCEQMLGRERIAAELDRRFKQAWNRADTKLAASCLCVEKATNGK